MNRSNNNEQSGGSSALPLQGANLIDCLDSATGGYAADVLFLET